jgi:hypothetical protein
MMGILALHPAAPASPVNSTSSKLLSDPGRSAMFALLRKNSAPGAVASCFRLPSSAGMIAKGRVRFQAFSCLDLMGRLP